MKIETIKERIQKATERLEKSNGTLERHTKQLDKKALALTNKGIDLTNYNKQDNGLGHENYWDLCDYESKLEDIKNTNKKIDEAASTLVKLNEQLENQLAKETETDNLIPEVLNIFLENWKQKCVEFYTILANEYIALVAKESKEYEITLEELNQLKKKVRKPGYNNYDIVNKYSNEDTEKILSGDIKEWVKEDIKREIRRRHIADYVKRHFASDMAVLDKIISFNQIDSDMLNKILDEDVKVKKEMFISRIKEVIGEIKDLSGLNVVNGEINGIAIGVKANAKVETISAGGYNIQCWHYRVLVNTIK